MNEDGEEDEEGGHTPNEKHPGNLSRQSFEPPANLSLIRLISGRLIALLVCFDLLPDVTLELLMVASGLDGIVIFFELI